MQDIRNHPLAHPTRWQLFCYRTELPTWAVAVAVYAGWLALTYYFTQLHWLVVLVAAPVLIAWHGSLRHECVHGHPFSFRMGSIVGAPPLNLIDPFPLYRKYHLIHHNNAMLTYPGIDTETYYHSREAWDAMPAWRRFLLTANQTFLGRMVINPWNAYLPWFKAEFTRIAKGDRTHLRIWLEHLAWCAVILYWVIAVCHIPLLHYLFFFTYLGTSLGMVRSFYEHRYHEDPNGRTVIVENDAFFHLLFLNNSFHIIHHDKPMLPWYVLKKMYREQPEKYRAMNHGFVEKSYLHWIKTYLLKPVFLPIHPENTPPAKAGRS